MNDTLQENVYVKEKGSIHILCHFFTPKFNIFLSFLQRKILPPPAAGPKQKTLTGQNYKLQITVVQCPGSNKASCRQFVGIKEKDNLSLQTRDYRVGWIVK
jgi:hypothetical protein